MDTEQKPEEAGETGKNREKPGKPGKMKPRGKPFEGVDDKRTFGMDPAVPVEELEGVPRQLSVMRHVGKWPRQIGESPEVKACRAWQTDDPAGFMKERTRLEAVVVEERKGVVPGVVDAAKEDVGTASCVSLCAGLLEDWKDDGVAG